MITQATWSSDMQDVVVIGPGAQQVAEVLSTSMQMGVIETTTVALSDRRHYPKIVLKKIGQTRRYTRCD